MAGVEFGWVLPMGPEGTARGLFLERIDQALDLASGHFQSAWVADHLQENGPGALLEGWTTLTYYAARHPGLQFGHAVLSQSFRNPALLAKMAATLQYLTGGRYILGIGTGWNEPEYAGYGYPFPPPGVRVAQLEETLAIIKALWREPQATFAGAHYRVQEAYCDPKPEPVPPIMIGGARPRMLRLIAREADWWCVSWTALARYRDQVAEMARACAEVERNPATLRRIWFGPCACAPTHAEALAQLGPDIPPERVLLGTPDEIVAQMHAFMELGVDYFQVAPLDFPALAGTELLIREVLPAMQASPVRDGGDRVLV